MFSVLVTKYSRYHNINLAHLFVVSVRASISMISSSLDGRKIQKSCLLANVNVDGKHLRQVTKINIQHRLPIVHCGNSVLAALPADEEWGKMKKTGSRTVGKKMAAVFRAVMIV